MARGRQRVSSILLRLFVFCIVCCFSKWIDAAGTASRRIRLEQCVADGMRLQLSGPFWGDIRVNGLDGCKFPIELLENEKMSFMVPYGPQCNVMVDNKNGLAVARLEFTSSAGGSPKYYETLTCENFPLNNNETANLEASKIFEVVNKEVQFVKPMPPSSMPQKSVFLNREREYARSVSASIQPDAELLKNLNNRRFGGRQITGKKADDDGFMTLTQRFTVKNV